MVTGSTSRAACPGTVTDGHRAKSGRWFSAAWWRGHWDARDDDGEYASVEQLASGRDRAEKRHHRQMKAEAARDEQRRAEKRRAPAPGRREQLREDVRLAQHDQRLRAEAQSRGYKRETAAFYGSAKEAAAEHSERRLTAAQADREATLAAEADREEAERYRAARAAQKTPKKIGQPAPADWLYRDRKRA